MYCIKYWSCCNVRLFLEFSINNRRIVNRKELINRFGGRAVKSSFILYKIIHCAQPEIRSQLNLRSAGRVQFLTFCFLMFFRNYFNTSTWLLDYQKWSNKLYLCIQMKFISLFWIIKRIAKVVLKLYTVKWLMINVVLKQFSYEKSFINVI